MLRSLSERKRVHLDRTLDCHVDPGDPAAGGGPRFINMQGTLRPLLVRRHGIPWRLQLSSNYYMPGMVATWNIMTGLVRYNWPQTLSTPFTIGIDSTTTEDILLLKSEPVCPAGGTYTVSSNGEVTCSVHQ